MSNLTPALTFILAIIFRTERLSLRSTNTQAKVMGTLVSISGALVVVLYKGPTVLSTTSERDWVKGGLLLTVGYLLFSAWSILQGLSQHYLQMQLYSRLYWQSCLRFLVFFGLIVVGGANMIEKAWHGDLVFHKHVLIPLSLCVFAFIRLLDKYRRLRRMRKKAMIVMPVDEKDE